MRRCDYEKHQFYKHSYLRRYISDHCWPFPSWYPNWQIYLGGTDWGRRLGTLALNDHFDASHYTAGEEEA
jgi:hypothetical protein